MKHPKTVEGFDGTLEELAEKVGNLRYDALGEFVGHLANYLSKEAEKDHAKGKIRLSAGLRYVCHHLNNANEGFDYVWRICKPKMKYR